MDSIKSMVDTQQILSNLTLPEKISLLAAKDWWRTPIIDRDEVFVPQIKTTDGPNGARGESYVSGIKAACFPCASSLGASFDTKLLYQMGQEIAKEAITKSANVLLAPTLNVIRSPLGGRNYETYSEDPVVLGQLAAAFVNGCQSIGIAATPKHFVANEAENQRKTLSVQVDEQTLREIYLLPFQLVMKLSKPLCLMTSYNRVNGIYVSDDHRLVEGILRKEWGFAGLVMSDWMGTYSTVDAVNAGLDLEMPGPTKMRGKKLLQAVEQGLVTEKTIDQSAQRVLDLAKALRRFEAPRNERPERAVDNVQRDTFIRDAAAEGMVLLKNDHQTLPLSKNASVAIIGHFATVASLGGGGSARVDSIRAVTPFEGLRQLGVNCAFSPGVPVFGALPHAEPSTVSETGKYASVDDLSNHTTPSIIRSIKLEWFNGKIVGQNPVHSEMIPTAEYMIKEAWPQYLGAEYCTKMTFDITPKTSRAHSFSVISTGPAICYINGKQVFHRRQETDLKLESFYFFKSKLERRFTHEMSAGQRYSVALEAWATDSTILNRAPLFGRMFQGASLRFGEHIDFPQAISAAAQSAEAAEYAVVCVGTTNEVESEGYDRETMDLPGVQYDLIRAVAAKNPKTIVVNFSGAPVTMDFVDDVQAIVQAWFPGQECGHSIARLLTGIINPSGRLPMSWPRRIEDNPSHGNFPVENDALHYAEGLDVGYRYYDRKSTPDPLFPFGFGLSYTTFEVSGARASSEMFVGSTDTVEISCHVRNTGFLTGKAVIQFYVQVPETNRGLSRPVKELKGFDKVELKENEEVIARAVLDKYSFSVYDADDTCWKGVKGTHTIHIGLSSQDIPAAVRVTLQEEFVWTGV